MNTKHKATINNGNMVLDDPVRFNHELRRYPEGTVVDVIVKRVKKGRSYSQNAYYWAVPIAMIADASGMMPEEVHDALRMEYLVDRSKKLPTILSTSTLSTGEFEDYLMKVRMFASEFFGIFVPKPNEVEYE